MPLSLVQKYSANLRLVHVMSTGLGLIIWPLKSIIGVAFATKLVGKKLLTICYGLYKNCRIFTATHAVNSKRGKFKIGAISESNNVGQVNSATGTALHLPQTSSPSLIPAAKGATSQDQSVGAPNSMGAGVVISTTVATAPVSKKKEVRGSLKVQTDKKKIDARKKSLKRL